MENDLIEQQKKLDGFTKQEVVFDNENIKKVAFKKSILGFKSASFHFNIFGFFKSLFKKDKPLGLKGFMSSGFKIL